MISVPKKAGKTTSDDNSCHTHFLSISIYICIMSMMLKTELISGLHIIMVITSVRILNSAATCGGTGDAQLH